MTANFFLHEINDENSIDLHQKHSENMKGFINNLTKSKNSQNNSMDLMKIYEVQMEYFYSTGDYNSALNYSIKLYEQFKSQKLDNKDTFFKLRKEMIKCWNIFALKHLEKNENEKAKNYLDMIENNSIEDYSSYVTTKTNLSCYFNNTNHLRNSKNVMSNIKRINIVKKLNEIYSETVYDINFEKKENNNQKQKNLQKHNFSDIALDYHNICSIQNKLKNYHDALIDGMHSVALNQFTCLMKDLNKNQNNSVDSEEKEKKDIPEYNLIMSYYNMGVQQEYMSRMIDCDNSFNESMELANKFGMEDHPLFIKLKKNKNKYNKIVNFRATFTLPPIKDLKSDDKLKKKTCFSNYGSSSINFKETFTNNEMMLFKLNPNPVEERVNKIISVNEKLKNHPYYISNTNFKKKTKPKIDSNDFKF